MRSCDQDFSEFLFKIRKGVINLFKNLQHIFLQLLTMVNDQIILVYFAIYIYISTITDYGK